MKEDIALLGQLGWRRNKVADKPEVRPAAPVGNHEWKSACTSNQPILSLRPRAERSGSVNDVPPPAYEIAVTQPTPVEEERPLGIGIEGRRTPPIAQTRSNAPIQTQPDHLEFQHPLGPTQNYPSRNPSNETILSSNPAHTQAGQAASALHEREEEGGRLATVGRTGTAPFEQPPVQPKQNANVINIFCCCSNRVYYGCPPTSRKANNGRPLK
ncbi:hypothetical protein EDB89DRAFT_1906169 [Lactarius sanguifluus]|nr:hypothetical protein EDB89DRAFT_1906169 [Lactarius sanguifluus]